MLAAYGLHMLAWLAMLIALAGVIFCAAGVYLAVAPALGAMPAAFVTGGSLLALLAAGLLVTMLAQSVAKHRQVKETRRNTDSILEQQIRPVIGDRATQWTKDNPGLAMVGALSAGVILAASPRLRSTLLNTAGPLLTRKTIRAVEKFTDPD